ncbi:hypothetical protein L210DRAFT_3534565 [Boletus edulis BED1]|uniref:PH domain-containing protein n=1 Tax=Boletus edulis BED1 TaxID=1328754 RepID=A0AAD4BYQ6_BOLED|nr:hypothetical protein L210DRAFT_3534565 [Boletus edulis BED1]
MPLSINLSQQSWSPRRPSVSSPSHSTNSSNATYIAGHPPSLKSKGKDRYLPHMDSDPFGFGHRLGHNNDHLDSKSSDSSPSATAYASSSHSAPLHPNIQQHSASLPSRHRMSILSVASDALGFRKKIGFVSRKKPNAPSLSHNSNNVMPEVIDIKNATVASTIGGTTAHKDYECEERERLRDVAAQSIGLDPELLHSSNLDNRSFLDSPQSPAPSAPMPPFPATLVALLPFTELSATLPKFTPPSSLLVYALAKQWKLRTIVLTSHSPSQKTHVHLFKGASKDEKEVERLEVTEDSVIYVAEEQVGGRGNVIKLAGKDVSLRQSGTTGEGSLRTMWFLQIKDPAESHRWIAAIKNAVLRQRAVRAGVDVTAQLEGGNEPKGDMDVMLSMHLQRIVSTHPINSSTAISPPSQLIPTSSSRPPSLRSLRINTSSSPTTATKGIFSGARPRSPSVEGSPTLTHPPGHTEDSFSAAGTSLLTMLRTKSSADSGSSPSHSLPLPPSHVPAQGSPAPSLRSTNAPIVITASDLKISKERDAPEASTSIPEASSSSTTPGANTPPAPSFPLQGALTFSLQPPPRKTKHTVTITPATLIHEPQGMYKQVSGNRSVAGNFGIPSRNTGDDTSRETPPVSPNVSNFSGAQSVSLSTNSGCEASSPVEAHVVNSSSPGGGSVPTDKLSQSTAITKRWSRQGVLPKQLTPPTGPPPSIPPSPENNHRISVESSVSISFTHVIDRSSSSSSSNLHRHPRTPIRPISGSSLSPTFWKRGSGSSTLSGSSINTSDSQGRSHMRSPFGGVYFPSSFGSIVSNGGSSRPMSLSVNGSSPVVHIGTAKRRSMPPPRPAPNFAPPPAPTVQESMFGFAPLTTPAPGPQKSFRSSVAQRALRLSLTSPKPPPSSALPPRPDEGTFVQGHRRSSSSGRSDIHPIPSPSLRPVSSLSRDAKSAQHSSSPKSLSIRQRLRILSTPPAQSSSSSIPSIQVSTLDLNDDNDDDPPTPCFATPRSFGLGEHIMTIQTDPSFLQLSSPITPTTPKPPPRSPFGPISPPLEADCDFVALSPPPPRKACKSHGARPEIFDIEQSAFEEREESKLVALSQRGSVVSLGFVTT